MHEWLLFRLAGLVLMLGLVFSVAFIVGICQERWKQASAKLRTRALAVLGKARGTLDADHGSPAVAE